MNKMANNNNNNENNKPWAIITGGISTIGVGYASAKICRRRNMNVLLLDIREKELTTTVEKLRNEVAGDGQIESKMFDVSKASAWDKLAFDYGPGKRQVGFLFLNAGVHSGKAIYEASAEHFEKVFQINVFGVANGLRSFTNLMLEQDINSYLVATASSAGLFTTQTGAYSASKQAVRNMMEQMHADLKAHPQGKKIQCHVLCPGFFRSGLSETSRILGTRSIEDEKIIRKVYQEQKKANAKKKPSSKNSTPPVRTMTNDETAEMLFAHIDRNEFYVLTSLDDGVMLRKQISIGQSRIQNREDPYVMFGGGWPRTYQQSDIGSSNL